MRLFLDIRSARQFAASVALAGTFGSFVTSIAAAQASSTPATSAQVQYRKAHEAINAKNWNEARRLLLDLWTRSETYDVAASLGQVEYWLKNYASGARYLTFALRNLPPAEKPEMIEQLQAALDELKTKLGTVKVLVNESGAEVRVDGEVVGTSPLSTNVYVDPGTHRFEARLANSSAESKLDATAGQGYVVELTLQAVSSTATPGPEAPQEGAATVEPGPSDTAADGKSPIPAYIAGGVAVLGLSSGIAFSIMAGNTTDRIESLQARVGQGGCSGTTKSSACEELVDEVENRDAQRNIAYASFAVAGAAALGGVVYLLWPSASPSRASVGVSRLPGGAFVTVRGRL